MIIKKLFSICISLVFITALGSKCNAQTRIYLTQKDIKPIIDTCLTVFKSQYIYADVVPKIEEYIIERIHNGQYSKIENLHELTKLLRKDFQHITKDKHIWIDTIENLLITDSGVPKEEIINQKKRNNFGFVEYKIYNSDIAYLRIDSFDDTTYAKETAIHAMGMLTNGKSIILDLRDNHGGHQNMVSFISSYFFKDRKQLNSLYFRAADSLVESWTDPLIPGKKLLDQNLFILTSKNTASGAESFVYSMKHYKRATIVGESTRGAAHWKETYKFSSLGIFAEIPVARPINPVTKRDWEGEGIKPDFEIPANQALDAVIKLALAKNLK
jgi:hypothetical protein